MFDAITGNDKIKEAEAEQAKQLKEEKKEEITDPAQTESSQLKDFITTEEMIEVMGGQDVVNSDKRLSDMVWQSKLILDNKVMLQDFIYILQFTETVEQ